MEEDVGLLLHNGSLGESNTSSLTVVWNSSTLDDGSNGGVTPLLRGLHFKTSEEEIRFVIAVSVYVLGTCLPQGMSPGRLAPSEPLPHVHTRP